MPVIPGTQEGQVLNAGSPVPISSPEETRMMGNAISGAGQGLFALGDALDVAAKNEKERRNRLVQYSALQKFRDESGKLFAKHQAAKRGEGDPDGYKSVQDFKDESGEVIGRIASEMGLEGDVALDFDNLARDNMNDLGKELLAKRIAKNEKENDALRVSAITKNGLTAAQNPSDMDNILAETEALIRNDPGQDQSLLETTVVDAKRKVIIGAINARKNADDFGTAKLIADKHGALLDAEVLDKVYGDIRTEKSKYLSNKGKEQENRERELKASSERALDVMQRTFHLQLTKAGVDMYERDQIFKAMDREVANPASPFKASHADALKGNKIFEAETDDRYEAKILNKLFENPKGITKLYQELRRDYGKEVSPTRYDKLMRLLDQERDNADPKRKQLIAVGKDIIDGLANPSILESLDKIGAKQARTVSVRTESALYVQTMMANPQLDPIAVAEKVAQKIFKQPTRYSDGSDITMENTIQGINEKRKRAVQEMDELKKNNKLTPQKKREFIRKNIIWDTNEKILGSKDSAQRAKIQQEQE